MMHRLILVLMSVLEHFILGEECQSFYDTQPVCDTIYGSTLSTYSQIRSLTECTVQCSIDDLCLSVIYLNGSGDCRTNTGILVTPDTGCLETVWYASLLQNSCNPASTTPVPVTTTPVTTIPVPPTTTPVTTTPVPVTTIPVPVTTTPVSTAAAPPTTTPVPVTTTPVPETTTPVPTTTASVTTTTVPVTTTTTTIVPTTTAAPGTIFGYCLANIDCAATSDAECRDNTCLCIAGLSFNYQTACVPDCGTYGTSFQPDLGHLLLGFNDKSLSVTSYIECLNACINEVSFTCRTAEMFLTEMTCYLSTTTVAMQPESHLADATFDLYQRDCAQTV